jgi:glucose/arabinose dehydrogenase
VAEGLTEPVFFTHAGDGTGRTFIVEQPGLIKIFQAGQVLVEPFLDIRDRVNDGANEQGLLGLAFHPQYAANGWLFVNYTGAQGQTVIARFTANGNVAEAASETIILEITQPYANHNGGHLAFGPDGFLYIGMGDGGAAGDPQDLAQNPRSLLGKMLRLDMNTEPYAIPPDNPFANQSEVRPEIWSLGWRNPWRFSFDRVTGDMYVGDVGQNQIEEVSFQPAASRGGENYGWRFLEGTGGYLGAPPEGLVPPIAEYTHTEGGCSVTGGYVYRGPTLTDLNGVYLFGDYCTGITWSLHMVKGAWERREFMDTDFVISSFGEDEAGELYVLNHRAGEVYQLVRLGD